MTPIPRLHRRRTVVLATLALPLVLLACGDDSSGASSAGDPAATGHEAAAWPVTIDHAFGSTTVEERPERVVTLGAQWTDVLLALDVQPVGYLDDPYAGDDGILPWQAGLSEDAEAIESTDSLPLEQIAALRPDLILVTYPAPDQATYDDLAAIAPTIGLLGERDVDRWQDLTEVAGAVFGDPEAAQSVIDDATKLVADTASELPGLEGRTFALANYVPGDALYVVADPEDGASVFFQDLGLQIDPTVLDAADGVTGRAEFSLEQAGLLDSDVLVLFANDGDPADLVGYEKLPAVVGGSAAVLDYEGVVGLNTPTPLSIPYSLELIRPALDAAAG